MNEFIIDDEYRFEKKPDRNIWNVYRNNELISFPQNLYKFFPLTIYSLDSLYRGYFHLANPETFNDPFDCNINLLEEIVGKEKMETVKRNNIKNVGICSLTETIDNHLMWAHYTNNYNGFAIEFDDIKVDNTNFKQSAIAPVIYPIKPLRVNTNHPYSHQYFLTTKLAHWNYEKEWRIVCHIENEDREMLFTDTTLRGIYIGHKVRDNNKGVFNLLLNIMEDKYPSASVYIVYPHPNDLRLEFEELKKKKLERETQNLEDSNENNKGALSEITNNIIEEVQKMYFKQMGIQHYEMTDTIVELLKSLKEEDRELIVNEKLKNCKHYFDPILERIKNGEV